MNPSPPEQWTPEEQVRFLAINAMGWEACVGGEEADPTSYWKGTDIIGGYRPIATWNPLTSGDDRDKLVEAMRKKGWVTSLENGRSASDGSCSQNWWVSTLVKIAHCRTQTAHALADTPGRAVCIAAIKALKAERKEQ